MDATTGGGPPLDRIQPFEVPAGIDTDDKTQIEQGKYERAERLRRLDPTGRHLAVSEELLDTLRGLCANLQAECECQKRDLDTLRPSYSALREAHNGSGWNNLLSTVGLAAAAIFIGSPSTINNRFGFS